MKKTIFIVALALLGLSAGAQQKTVSRDHRMIAKLSGHSAETVYNASVFGIKSNGLYDNTASFQKAVDFISENGGGTLYVSVGRYLTGAVQLKDNVAIYIRGTIVGSPNIYDYQGHKAIFWADGAKNVTVKGGVVEGQGKALRAQIKELQQKGYLSAECPVPTLFYFKDCEDVTMEKVICRYPASDELYVTENSNAKIEGCINDTKE